jgi:serine/threonine-protein kinase
VNEDPEGLHRTSSDEADPFDLTTRKRVSGTGETDALGYHTGQMVDDAYVLIRVLARSGTAAVWVVQHTGTGQQFALKMLHDPSGMVHATERVAREANSLAKIQHPNVVKVVRFGLTKWADPFVVMELLVGPTLQDLLARGGRLRPTDAVQLLLPIADALKAIHAAGILHRDLKPENVICVRSSFGYTQPKIIDFGIAAGMGGGVGRITQTGIVLGSAEYVAPERARGAADVDGRSDLWSFCVMLYELVAGQTPYSDAASSTEVLTNVLERAVPPLERFGVQEPELGAILARGLQKQPKGRWPDMQSLGRALAAWLVSKGVYEDVEGNSLETTWLSTPASLAPMALDAAPEAPAPVFPQDDPPYQLPKKSWVGSALGVGVAAVAFVSLVVASTLSAGEWRASEPAAPPPVDYIEREAGVDFAPLVVDVNGVGVAGVDAGVDAGADASADEVEAPAKRKRSIPWRAPARVPAPAKEPASTPLPTPRPPPAFE